MVLEMFNIDRCTGNFLMEFACINPKINPTKTIILPQSNKLLPLIAPSKKLVFFRIGRVKSASLAKPNIGNNAIDNEIKIFFIN